MKVGNKYVLRAAAVNENFLNDKGGEEWMCMKGAAMRGASRIILLDISFRNVLRGPAEK